LETQVKAVQHTQNSTELLQQRRSLPCKNKSSEVSKFCTCRKQTLEPGSAQNAKQAVQSSERVHNTIRQTSNKQQAKLCTLLATKINFQGSCRHCQTLKSAAKPF
jgi:hypothetical protein